MARGWTEWNYLSDEGQAMTVQQAREAFGDGYLDRVTLSGERITAEGLRVLREPLDMERAVELALNCKPFSDGDEAVQYILIRGLSAIGFNLPSHASWDVMRQALLAALPALGMGWREALERAANLVEDNQQTTSSTAQGDTRGLTPRKHGNLDGLAYAEAIRALAQSAPEAGNWQPVFRIAI